MENIVREKRATKSSQSIRAIPNVSGTTERFIEGYGSVFNQPSKLLIEWHGDEYRAFYEVILPGAFDEVLANPELNCLHTVDHNSSKLIGRTRSGTLKLSVDEIGLKYLVSVPDTTTGNDLYELVQRGDYYESSFVFTVAEDGERWEEKDGKLYRYISKVSGLYDTSTVTDGAYANTIVLARGTNVDPEKLKDFQNVVVTDQFKIEYDLNTVDVDFYFSRNKSR